MLSGDLSSADTAFAKKELHENDVTEDDKREIGIKFIDKFDHIYVFNGGLFRRR